MKKISRLMSILTLLQARTLITAEEMAQRFEVSIRTIYRDLRVLEEAGVPIGAEAGKGYFLADGYSLPPINISEEEAFAVITAQNFVENQGDTSLQENYRSLSAKVAALLKTSQKEKLERIQSQISPSLTSKKAKSSLLGKVQSALGDRQVLKISYQGADGSYTEREVESLGLYYTLEAWILVAYCRLRNDKREFRLDRILKADSTGEEFPPKFFRLEDYFKRN